MDTGSGKHRKLINLSDLSASLGESCRKKKTPLGFCVHGRGLYKILQRKRKMSCATGKAQEELQVSWVFPIARWWLECKSWCAQRSGEAQVSDAWTESRDVSRWCSCQASLQNDRRRRVTHIQIQSRLRSPSPCYSQLSSKATCSVCEPSWCVVQTGTSSNRGIWRRPGMVEKWQQQYAWADLILWRHFTDCLGWD